MSIFAFRKMYSNMRKLVALILCCLSMATLCYAQEYQQAVEQWDSEEIRGNNYHGFAFNESHPVNFTIESQDGRYALTEEDIANAERLIQKKIAYLNREHINQEGKTPLIDEHMNKYERQYVGFTDVYGYHIAWVNFVWDDNVKPRLGKDVILTEGGASHYWHVKVNLDTEKVYGLHVNESGKVKYLPSQKKPKYRMSRPRRDYNPQRIRKTGIIHTEAEKQF